MFLLWSKKVKRLLNQFLEKYNIKRLSYYKQLSVNVSGNLLPKSLIHFKRLSDHNFIPILAIIDTNLITASSNVSQACGIASPMYGSSSAAFSKSDFRSATPY